jgi:conjugal transfer pilus assembly protein TraW
MFINLFIIGFSLVMCSPGYAAVHNLGTHGRTYAIVEKNAIQELKTRAAAVDWGQVFSSETMGTAIKEYKPDLLNLPPANETSKRLVDISYTLDIDIPDGKGGILYPAGYTFNPLEYTRYMKTIVVINGDDPAQVKWFSASDYAGSFNTMLLLSDGSYFDLAQRFERPVFYASSQIVKRLQLRAVPSVVRQAGKYLEVEEIALQNN